MTTVLAIDQGTSGTKALVVDGEDRVVSVVELPVRPHYLSGGGVEIDPQTLLESVVEAGRRAVTEARVAVDCMTLANQGETVLAWDPATGRPLTPAIVWQDRRSADLCTRLSGSADLIAERTGLVLDPYFSAPKMRWIRDYLSIDGVVTTSDTWLVHQLTGEFVTDTSTASRSLLVDLEAVSWDGRLLELFGLTDEALPRIVGSDEIVGETTVFGAPVPVGGLVVDQQAALLAQHCLAAGEAKCTFGTGAFVLANLGEQAARSGAGLASSVAWRTRERTTYCVDGQVPAAASAVRWIHDLGLLTSADELDRSAADNAEGVLCVPALAGLSAPWWAPTASASLTGMTLSTSADHIVRAVLDGIAAQVAELVDCVARDIGRPLPRLRVDGGLTRSRVLLQTVADLTGAEVEVYPSAHATALGAAAFARLAAHAGLSPRDAIVGWSPSATLSPHLDPDAAADFRARWRCAAETTAVRKVRNV